MKRASVIVGGYAWPDDIVKTEPSRRILPRRAPSFVAGWGRLRRELAACGFNGVAVHMDVTLDRDGFPPKGFDFSTARPGVVIVGPLGRRVLACDTYVSLPANVSALAAYLRKLREASYFRVHDSFRCDRSLHNEFAHVK